MMIVMMNVLETIVIMAYDNAFNLFYRTIVMLNSIKSIVYDGI